MAIEAKRWTTNRVLVIAGVLALGGIVLYLFLKLSLTDEPPIRVRKGSVDFETCNNSPWQSDSTHWFPQGSGSNGLRVRFTSGSTTQEAECMSGTLEGNVVKVFYSDGHTIQVVAAGNKMKILRTEVSQHPNRADVLRYTAANNDPEQTIEKIEILGSGEPQTCIFGESTQLTHAVICSSADPANCGCNLP